MRTKIYLLYLNEATLVRFLWWCFIRRQPYIVAVSAWFPPAQRLLERLVSWAMRSGRALDAMELTPMLLHVRDRFSEIHFYNVFDHLEEWQNAYYGFETIEQSVPKYAMAYKNVVTKNLLARYLPILILDRLASRTDLSGLTVYGLTQSTHDALRAYRNSDWPGTIRAVSPAWFPAANFLLAVGVTLYGLVWSISRTRMRGSNQESVFLAADYLGDARDTQLYNAARDGGPVLLVVRQKNNTDAERLLFERFKSCRSTDGRLSFAGLVGAIGILIRDGASLTAHFLKHEPGLFFHLVALPYRRVVIRALLNRYRPRFYWGRDDYNVEHLLRYEELDRIGSCSMGVSHGFATYCDITPAFRYISYHRYYVFGRVLAEVYGDTWNPKMDIKAIGTFGAWPDDYEHASKPRPADIAVFTGVFVRQQNLVDLVRTLAERFPKRTIWLQVKGNYRGLSFTQKFVDKSTRGLPNVRYTEDPLFEIFKRTQYAFSDPSTVILEAMQFGLASYMLDIGESHEVCMLRDYPDLCVTSPDDAIERIQNIESGLRPYPRQSYEHLIDMSGRPFIDVLRADLGLPARVQGIRAI